MHELSGQSGDREGCFRNAGRGGGGNSAMQADSSQEGFAEFQQKAPSQVSLPALLCSLPPRDAAMGLKRGKITKEL